jgi:histidine triad (HIT) family protein
VIPKNHSNNHLELSSEEYSELFAAVQKVSHIINKTFNPKVVAVMVEGLEVDHTHVHLIPLNSTGELGTINHIDIDEEKLNNTHRKLTNT